MSKSSFATFTGEEFAQALSAGTLREAVVVTGMAKKGDDSQSILFAPGKECGDWIPIPATMIDQVDWLGKASCKDHVHDYVRLRFAPISTPEAKVFVSLLVKFLDCGCGPPSDHSATGTPSMQGFLGQQAGITGFPSAIPQASPPAILATIQLGQDHTLTFVEFMPGISGFLEVGRVNVDVPAAGPEMKNLSLLDQYLHFAGASAQVPQGIYHACKRSLQRSPQLDITPPQSSGIGGSSKRSDAFERASEQLWFRNTFCNGAQACVQSWDWATTGSNRKVNAGTGIAMVGSEGTVNATFVAYFWDCWCSGPFCIFGSGCLWFELWRGLVVPGHWVSVTFNVDDRYLKWNLNGAGGDTEVSLAAQY